MTKNVDLPTAGKLGKGRVHGALLGDVAGDGEYLDTRELGLDEGFLVEKKLLSASERAIRDAPAAA